LDVSLFCLSREQPWAPTEAGCAIKEGRGFAKLSTEFAIISTSDQMTLRHEQFILRHINSAHAYVFDAGAFSAGVNE
jgi:hypothetical protein